VFLLEAYASSAGRPSADELRAAIEAGAGLRVIGLLDIPTDEAVLCLVAAESDAGISAITALAEGRGPTARLLRVSWTPSLADAIGPDSGWPQASG